MKHRTTLEPVRVCATLAFLLLLLPSTAAARAGLPYLAPPDEDDQPTSESTDDVDGEALDGAQTDTEGVADEPTKGAAAARVDIGFAPEHFLGLWEQRRVALAENDPDRAAGLLTSMLDKKVRSGWPDHFTYGEVLARESRQAIARGNPTSALRLAKAAVTMAPHRQESYYALASAEWSAPDGTAVNAGLALWQAYSVGWQEPPMADGRLGNLSLTLLFTTVLGALVFALVAIFRHARQMVHDLHHLLPRGATRLQSAIIGIAILLAPIFFRTGLVWTLLVWLLFMALYFERRERLAAVAVFLALAAFSLTLPPATDYLSFPGSRGEALYATLRDMGAAENAAQIASEASLTPEELFALGLRARWSGDLERAADLLSRAERAGGRHPALLTALGNVRFGLGDARTAVAYYEKASQVDPEFVPARFNAARVLYGLAEPQLAGDAHRSASAIDYPLVEKLDRLAKRFGPTFVVPIQVPRQLLAVEYPDDRLQHERTVAQIWSWFGGELMTRYHFAAAALAALVLTILLGALRRYLKPSAQCQRCSQPACRRCNPEIPDTTHCGQCHHAFVSKDGTDTQARVAKEIQVHRHLAHAKRLRGILSVFLLGQLLRGDALKGLFFLVTFVACLIGCAFGLGWIPEPVAYLPAQSLFSAILIGAAGASVYLAAMWDYQRGER